MVAALDDLHEGKFVFEGVKPPGEAFCSEMGHLHAFRGAESASKRAACHTQQNTDEDTHARAQSQYCLLHRGASFAIFIHV